MSRANLVPALVNQNEETQRIIASWMWMLQLKDPGSKARAGDAVMSESNRNAQAGRKRE